MPAITSSAATQRSTVNSSPRTSQADSIPATGTSSENGATVLASYSRSRNPHRPKPSSVETHATNPSVAAPDQSNALNAATSASTPSTTSDRPSSGTTATALTHTMKLNASG